MSNGSSATNWIVGCLVVGILCLVACAGAGVLFVRWGMQKTAEVTQELAEEMDRQAQAMQEASNWNLPGGWTSPGAEATVDELLPIQVGEWERMFQASEPAVPFLNIERETNSGVYATDGHSVDVYVCRVAAEEQEAVFEQAQTAITDGVTGHTYVGSEDGTTRTLFYRTWGEEGAGWLIWNGGWLFSIQTADPQAPLDEFMTAYFEAISARPSPGDAPDAGTAPAHDDPGSAAQPVPADDAAENADAAATTTDAATP